jgi:hypothetical protein
MIYPACIPAFLIALLWQPILHAQPLTASVILSGRVAPATSDTIYHKPGQSLIWANFLGTPNIGGRVAALTSSGFGFNAGMSYSNQKGKININVYAFFNKSKSWVKPDKKTPYILAHEQLHFDISCIGMLLFVQKLRATDFTVQNYSAELNRIYTEAYTLMQDMQDDYDTGTNNGLLRTEQQQWAGQIKGQLALLLSTVK